MKITMDEIARLAGVSKATVSRVLNNSADGVGEETRRRVQKVADDLHYSVNSDNRKNGASYARYLALILPDITNPFFADLAKAVEASARRYGYSLIITNTDFSEENEASQIRELVIKKLDGIILVPSGMKVRQEHFLPEKWGIPLVLMDRKLEGGCSYPGVYSNNEYASVISCEFLINNGSRDIVFISGPLNVSTSIERFEGYKAVLQQYNIPFRQELVRNGNYTVESGYNAVVELERNGVKYSAILAANDMMALGALKAVRELGYKVPDAVQIVGFDNIEFSQYCEPPLSTVQQPTCEMGAKAVKLLVDLIEKKPVAAMERLIPKLLMRKTTK